MSGEFAGTTLFLFFAFSGTQVALLSSRSSSGNVVGAQTDPAKLLYIALSFGFVCSPYTYTFIPLSNNN
jgi:aquaporin related protein